MYIYSWTTTKKSGKVRKARFKWSLTLRGLFTRDGVRKTTAFFKCKMNAEWAGIKKRKKEVTSSKKGPMGARLPAWDG